MERNCFMTKQQIKLFIIAITLTPTAFAEKYICDQLIQGHHYDYQLTSAKYNLEIDFNNQTVYYNGYIKYMLNNNYESNHMGVSIYHKPFEYVDDSTISAVNFETNYLSCSISSAATCRIWQQFNFNFTTLQASIVSQYSYNKIDNSDIRTSDDSTIQCRKID